MGCQPELRRRVPATRGSVGGGRTRVHAGRSSALPPAPLRTVPGGRGGVGGAVDGSASGTWMFIGHSPHERTLRCLGKCGIGSRPQLARAEAGRFVIVAFECFGGTGRNRITIYGSKGRHPASRRPENGLGAAPNGVPSPGRSRNARAACNARSKSKRGAGTKAPMLMRRSRKRGPTPRGGFVPAVCLAVGSDGTRC